jgi:glycerol-3-phosphate dehydrogenase (NAD(P)+)
MSERIGVIGAGAWGTALAKVLCECGHKVAIWCNEPETAADISKASRNERFLPGVRLPKGLAADTDPLAVASGKDVVILAVPSPYLMGVAKRILPAPNIMDGQSLIVTVTKGFVAGSSGQISARPGALQGERSGERSPRLIVETLEDYLPGFYRGNTVYLSGPSHAEEVSRGKITGLAAASQNGRSAIRTRELFRGSSVLVFPSLDVVGVQVCAAAKNVVAVAFGMLDAIAGRGLAPDARGERATRGERAAAEFGDNTESFLLAAGLNEMQTLGVAMGATHPETFTSIAGVGDLDVTCRSIHGRNRRFGREIVEKGILKPFRDLDDLLGRLGELGYLPEGAVACKHVQAIAAERKLDLPIMGGVHSILDRKIEPIEFLERYLRSMGAGRPTMGASLRATARKLRDDAGAATGKLRRGRMAARGAAAARGASAAPKPRATKADDKPKRASAGRGKKKPAQ